jgi:response regulator RpfG family c-di-GMP phosphodiesterase
MQRHQCPGRARLWMMTRSTANCCKNSRWLKGLEVVTAPDCRSSLEEFARTKPDIVLLNVSMLFVDGFEVCRRLKSNSETRLTPVVFVTTLPRLRTGCAEFRPELMVPIIRHHHQKLNASGYPDALKGDAVPITAGVLQIVDVYDARTTHRPYKRALSSSEALGIMEEEVAKHWWDADIFTEFKKAATSPNWQAGTRSAAAGANQS